MISSQEFKDIAKKEPIGIMSLIISFITLIILIILSYTRLAVSDIKDIRALIDDEANIALNKNYNKISDIYIDDACIRDWAAYSPQWHPKEVWRGITEIRDRYQHVSNLVYLKHIDVHIDDINPIDNSATATSSTDATFIENGDHKINIGSIGGDKWEFIKINGKWKISSFTYNSRATDK